MDDPDGQPVRAADLRELLTVLRSLCEGDFSARATRGQPGVLGELAEVCDRLASRQEHLSSELRRVRQEVSRHGRLDERLTASPGSGGWETSVQDANELLETLTAPLLDSARTLEALAAGELSPRAGSPGGTRPKGDLLRLEQATHQAFDQLSLFTGELTRLAHEVGTEGRLGGRARQRDLVGEWKRVTEALNTMAARLTGQVRDIAAVTTAVARGDLTRKVTAETNGELLELKLTVNSMVDQLSAFADEVTRVAREVGTDGALGGQAHVPGALGVWRRLTDNVNSMASNLTAQVRGISQVTTAVARGDLSQKITVSASGEVLQLVDTVNSMVDQLSAFADEVTRVAREVGTDGALGGQAHVPGALGVWRRLTDNVNSMASNLTAQVREISRIATAVAGGDLTKKIDVYASGEVLELKNTLNTMVDTLSSFSSEVTRVAREVGSEGRLGGQARVEGVHGTWKQLTTSVNELALNLTTQVRAIGEVASAVARGDMSRSIAVRAEGEVAELKDNVNLMVANLRETTRTRDWLESNLTRFAGLTQGHRDLVEVADLLLRELTPLVNAQAGAFYLAVTPGGRDLPTVPTDRDRRTSPLHRLPTTENGTDDGQAAGAGASGTGPAGGDAEAAAATDDDREGARTDDERDGGARGAASGHGSASGPGQSGYPAGLGPVERAQNLTFIAGYGIESPGPHQRSDHRADGTEADAEAETRDTGDTRTTEPTETTGDTGSSGSAGDGGSASAPPHGLLAQAVREKKRILVEDAPPGYITVESGLGSASAVSVLILPILYEERLLGVIELASFGAFHDIQLTFLDQLAQTIGVSVNTLIANARTESLLSQSQLLTSELRKRSEELQRSNAELERKAAELATSSQYKTEFLANMSHELRTPLNSLLILARLLAENPDGRLSEQEVDYASTIHRSGSDLLQLINEILDLSKVEAGQMAIHPKTFPLDKLLDYVRSTFRPLATDRGLDFEIRVGDAAPSELHSDEQRLKQVLRNLLSNAIKFTESGGVEVTVDAFPPGEFRDAPEEGLRDARSVIAFSVRDTGVGIPPEKQSAVFEAFQQSHGTADRKYGGTGLGLSISRDLAQLLGGRLEVLSEPGQGSRFTLYVPRESPAGPAETAGTAGMARTGVPETPSTDEDDEHTTQPPELGTGTPEDGTTEDAATAGTTGRTTDADESSRTPGSPRPSTPSRPSPPSESVAASGAEPRQLPREGRPEPAPEDERSAPSRERVGERRRSAARPDTEGTTEREAGRAAQPPTRGAAEPEPVSRPEEPAQRGDTWQDTTQLKQWLNGPPGHVLTGQQILIVDDDIRNVFALTQVLGRIGISVKYAENGTEGFDVLDRSPEVSLVLMDLMMPEMDGYQLMRTIRQTGRLASTPIIALTAKAMPEDREQAMESGADAYLPKPVNVDLLLTTMFQLLSPTEEHASDRDSNDSGDSDSGDEGDEGDEGDDGGEGAGQSGTGPHRDGSGPERRNP